MDGIPNASVAVTAHRGGNGQRCLRVYFGVIQHSAHGEQPVGRIAIGAQRAKAGEVNGAVRDIAGEEFFALCGGKPFRDDAFDEPGLVVARVCCEFDDGVDGGIADVGSWIAGQIEVCLERRRRNDAQGAKQGLPGALRDGAAACWVPFNTHTGLSFCHRSDLLLSMVRESHALRSRSFSAQH